MGFLNIIFLPTKHLEENIYFALLDTKDLQPEKQGEIKNEQYSNLHTYG